MHLRYICFLQIFITGTSHPISSLTMYLNLTLLLVLFAQFKLVLHHNYSGFGIYINETILFFIVAPCILITPKILSPTNAPLYYTYKMLKYTARSSPDCSYMFRSTWTIIREPMPNLAKVTILCRYSVKIRP